MPIQPINRTFAYGKEGSIEMRPIDDVAQSTLAPASTQSTQQQTAINPNEIIKAKLKALGDQAESQYNNIRDAGLAPEVTKKLLVEIQNEYNQAKSDLVGIESQLNLIQQSVGVGEMTPEAGREASLRMIMPRETVDLMFPSVKQGPTPSATGTSLSERNAVKEYFGKGGDGGESVVNYGGWFGRAFTDPTKVKELYKAEHDIRNLNDPRNVNKISGFNAAFKAGISELPKGVEALNKLLDPKTGDPDMLRWFSKTSESQLGRAFNSKVDSVSPMAKSIQDETRGQRGRGSGNGSYSIGQIISQGGTRYKVVGFDLDGMPLVEEAR